MSKITNFARQFWADEEGATAIEYGLLAALIAVAIIAGATLLGGNLNALFTRIANCMANPGAGCAAAPAAP
jgi:pilus assembly protein Flp/PilA